MASPFLGRDKPFAGFVRNGNDGRATWFQPLSRETQIFLAFAGAARAGGNSDHGSGCIAPLARAADRQREMSHHIGRGNVMGRKRAKWRFTALSRAAQTGAIHERL
jgi:hypothetical protein